MTDIGIDLERLRNLNSGLGQFCQHLYQHIYLQRSGEERFHIYVPADMVPAAREGELAHRVGFLDKIWGVRNRSLRLFHATHQDSHLIPYATSIRNLLTIHDLNFLEKYKDPAKRRSKLSQLQKKVDRSAGIAFISRYTETIARAHLHIPQSVATKVIYNGNNLETGITPVRPEWMSAGDYFFSIGIIQPKKNFHVLLPLIRHTGIPLVIAGKAHGAYAAQLRQQAEDAGIGNLLIMPGAISDAEKQWLFLHCKAFLFPSLAEGFGMPVVEAMQAGVPVFLSHLTSLPEIGGEDAYYWHSFEPEYMIKVLEQGLSRFYATPELKLSWQQRAGLFSWEKAAAGYLQFYREILAN